MKVKHPLISVIIPNYNHALFLKERIDSVLNQTYQDFELIILDDCSTDNSREIIELYRNHPKVSHIEYNEINSGTTFKQWLKGLALSKGDYIWIAESDDYAANDFLSEHIEAFQKYPKASLVISGSYYIDETSNLLKFDPDKWYIPHNNESFHYYEGDKYLNKYMLYYNRVYNASMVVFKKPTIEINGELFKFKFSGDWLFWIELILKGGIVEIWQKQNYFRQHLNKVTSKSRRLGLGYIEWDLMIDYLVENNNLSARQKHKALGAILYSLYHDNDIEEKHQKECLINLKQKYKCTFFWYGLYYVYHILFERFYFSINKKMNEKNSHP